MLGSLTLVGGLLRKSFSSGFSSAKKRDKLFFSWASACVPSALSILPTFAFRRGNSVHGWAFRFLYKTQKETHVHLLRD